MTLCPIPSSWGFVTSLNVSDGDDEAGQDWVAGVMEPRRSPRLVPRPALFLAKLQKGWRSPSGRGPTRIKRGSSP